MTSPFRASSGLRGLAAAALLASCAFTLTSAFAAPVAIEDFVRAPEFDSVRLSFDGKLLAITVNKPDRDSVAFVRVSDLAIVASWDMGKDVFVEDMQWVGNEQVVFKIAARFGSFDFPQRHHGIFSLILGRDDLTRYLVHGDDRVIGWMPDNPEWLILEHEGSVTGTVPLLRRLNLGNGNDVKMALGPAEFGDFLLDADGKLRYFFGTYRDLGWVLSRRDGDEWTEILRGSKHDSEATPVMVTGEGDGVLLRRVGAHGRYGIERLNTSSGEYTPVSSDPRFDADGWVFSSDRRTLLAVSYKGIRPSLHYVSPEHADARLLRSLEDAFAGLSLQRIDQTPDGKLLLLWVYSDRDPGQLYLFDRVTGQARFLLSGRKWIDPQTMAQQKPIALKSRDGLDLHGYVWLPAGSEGKSLPLVVRPHGGPFDVRDEYGFDEEAQLLASRGYAVLTINYRGSAGYGADFEAKGYGEWGGTMINDVTDAVRWTVEQGIVDEKRICVYGASYGAYAAMMSAVMEPGLYRCAVGYAGMYDIPKMLDHDRGQSRLLGNYFEHVYPKGKAARERQSPARRANEIAVPVMLAHGTKDLRTPLAQHDIMVRALKKAGRPVEVELVKSGEGHGFSTHENRLEFYTTLLAFLDKHIGTGASAPTVN